VQRFLSTYPNRPRSAHGINDISPYRFPEKLIPLMIANAFGDHRLPAYGDGQQVRDWLYVGDPCRGIYSGNRSLPNLDVIHKVLQITGKLESPIDYGEDCPGHDRRYALSSEKPMHETGRTPVTQFEAGLPETIEWRRANAACVARVRSRECHSHYEKDFGDRMAAR
jgi:dTDP-glucose 4,6-dehydratase